MNMKKFAIVLCMLGLISFGAGQADAAKWAGFKAGVNLANIGGDDAGDDTSIRTGIMGGAFVGFGINEQFGVQIEGLYVMKGAKSTEEDSTLTGVQKIDVTYKADYIEFPVLLAVRFPSGDKMAFNLFAGPTFGFNIKAEGEAEGVTVDFKDETKSFELGAVVGGGFYYMLDSFSVVMDARYGLGATSISEEFEGVTPDVKNRGIGIMVGVAFPLGGSH